MGMYIPTWFLVFVVVIVLTPAIDALLALLPALAWGVLGLALGAVYVLVWPVWFALSALGRVARRLGVLPPLPAPPEPTPAPPPPDCWAMYAPRPVHPNQITDPDECWAIFLRTGVLDRTDPVYRGITARTAPQTQP